MSVSLSKCRSMCEIMTFPLVNLSDSEANDMDVSALSESDYLGKGFTKTVCRLKSNNRLALGLFRKQCAPDFSTLSSYSHKAFLPVQGYFVKDGESCLVLKRATMSLSGNWIRKLPKIPLVNYAVIGSGLALLHKNGDTFGCLTSSKVLFMEEEKDIPIVLGEVLRELEKTESKTEEARALGIWCAPEEQHTERLTCGACYLCLECRQRAECFRWGLVIVMLLLREKLTPEIHSRVMENIQENLSNAFPNYLEFTEGEKMVAELARLLLWEEPFERLTMAEFVARAEEIIRKENSNVWLEPSVKELLPLRRPLSQKVVFRCFKLASLYYCNQDEKRKELNCARLGSILAKVFLRDPFISEVFRSNLRKDDLSMAFPDYQDFSQEQKEVAKFIRKWLTIDSLETLVTLEDVRLLAQLSIQSNCAKALNNMETLFKSRTCDPTKLSLKDLIANGRKTRVYACPFEKSWCLKISTSEQPCPFRFRQNYTHWGLLDVLGYLQPTDTSKPLGSFTIIPRAMPLYSFFETHKTIKLKFHDFETLASALMLLHGDGSAHTRLTAYEVFLFKQKETFRVVLGELFRGESEYCARLDADVELRLWKRVWASPEETLSDLDLIGHQRADCFRFGLLIAILLLRQELTKEVRQNLLTHIDGDMTLAFPNYSKLTRKEKLVAEKVVKRCLVTDVKKRATAKECFNMLAKIGHKHRYQCDYCPAFFCSKKKIEKIKNSRCAQCHKKACVTCRQNFVGGQDLICQSCFY